MKTPSFKLTPVIAGLAAASLAFSPVLRAQTADSTSNTKALNSADSANNNSSTTGAPSDQTGTLDKTNSKDTSNSLDKNPSQSATDSANKSGTKDPNATDTNDKDKMAKSSESKGDSSDSKGMSDQAFLLKAAQGGMTEVELGKLAQEKGSAANVKEFGSHMVMDHSKANDNLKSLAEKKGVTVPTTLDAKHQAMVNHLQSLSGPAFDKAYVHAMVKAHEKDATEFREESTSAQDPEVKSFASDTLKVVEMHLSDIKSIESSMK